MKKAGKGLIRIVTATAVTIFSLFTGITGVYAWFKTTMSATIEASMFEVTNGSSSVTMGEVTLYKFVYGKTTFGEELVDDYANPNRGHVGKYAFDKTKGENGQFGYTDEETHEWVPVTAMNVYDPVNLLVAGNDLYALNCNVIYKVTIHSTDFTDSYASVKANKFPKVADILLSSCVDFDVFFESDLSDPALSETDENGKLLYYPSYLDKEHVMDAEAGEDVYYKLSYLAKKKTQSGSVVNRNCFYDKADETISLLIDDQGEDTIYPVEFVGDSVSVYINVNYAPDQLEEYSFSLTPGQYITVAYDFTFEFKFTEDE